jgi:hypothetical protein
MSGARSARRGPGPAPGRPGELLAALESAVDDGSDVLDVHRTLLRQVVDGDAEGAHQTLRDHFRQTVDRLRGGLSEPFRTVSGEPDGSGYSFNPLG